MTKVFVVQHCYQHEQGNEEIKLIGVYSSQESANKAVSDTGKLPGFKNHPNGFYIDLYDIDQSHWLEGFTG